MNGQDEKSQICTSRERKAARILGLILGAFIICWLPFFLKELLVGLQVLQASQLLSDTLTWLGYVNSLINPLLYTSFNDDFKLAFKKLYSREKSMHRSEVKDNKGNVYIFNVLAVCLLAIWSVMLCFWSKKNNKTSQQTMYCMKALYRKRLLQGEHEHVTQHKKNRSFRLKGKEKENI